MAKRISIRDIARKVGMHYTTVGLALRDSPRLKKQTREKIRALAEQLGYRPDPMLSALVSYRNSKRPAAFHAVIAWVNNWPDRKRLLENPVYARYYSGAAARARDLGYELQEFWMHEPGMTAAKLQRILLARNIGGLLISPQPQPRLPIGFDFGEFAAVAFGYSFLPNRLHIVTNHHAQTIDLVVEKLLESGYCRPGYAIPPASDAGVNFIWISRFEFLCSRRRGFSRIPRLEAEGEEALAKWLKKYKPDAVIGFNSQLPQIEALGYRVPGDFGFASVSADPESPRIAGAYENDVLIGRNAVDVLVGMIHRAERGFPEVPVRTLVDSTWLEGKTLTKRNSDPRKTARAQ